MCKKKCVCFNRNIRSIMMKKMLEIKNRSHRYDTNRPRPKDRHKILNSKCGTVRWWLCVLGNTSATFEAKFMQNSSNTKAELKKSLAYKKSEYS